MLYLILQNDFKKWLYHNLHTFFSNDQYLKHYNTKILLYRLKFEIRAATRLSSLLENLEKIPDFNISFKVRRKFNNDTAQYFIYPSIYRQVESFVETWGEISNFEEKVMAVYNITYDNSPSRSSRKNQKLRQFVFGVTPNVFTWLSIRDKQGITYNEYELSKVSYIRRSFKVEYENFKKAIHESVDTIDEGFILQTDLVGFYHTLEIDQLINYFNSRLGWDNVVKQLIKIRNENITELPIGWILSPFLVYQILIDLHEDLKARLKILGVKSVKPLSYVDDFVFVVDTNNPVSEEEKSDISQALMDNVILIFKEYGFSKVQFHPLEAEKTKIIEIDRTIKSQLRENFFDLLMRPSETAFEGDSCVDWHIVDDLLRPTENGITLNDNVFLNKVIKNLKQSIKNDDLQEESFDHLYNKTLYRLEKNNYKYIESFFSFLREYFYHSCANNVLTINMIDKYVKNVCDSIVGQHFSINTYVIFLKGLWVAIPDDFVDRAEVYNKYEKIIFGKFRDSGAEKALLEFNLIERTLESLNTEISIKKFKRQRRIVEMPFFNEYKRYEEVYYSLHSNIGKNIKKLRCFEIYLVVEIFIQLSRSISSFDYIESIRKLRTITKTSEFDKIFLSFLEESLYHFMPNLSVLEVREILKMNKSTLFKESSLFKELNKFLSKQKEIVNAVEASSDQKFIQFQNYLSSVISKKKYNGIEHSNKWQISHSIYGEKAGKRLALQGFVRAMFCYLSSDMGGYQRNLYYGFRKIESSFLITFDSLSPNFNAISYDVANVLAKILEQRNDQDFIKYLIKLSPKMKSKTVDGLSRVDVDKIIGKDQIDLLENREKLKITLAPLSFDEDTLTDEFTYKSSVKYRIRKKVNQAIDFAVKQNSQVIIFPEMSLPRDYLKGFLNKCARHNLLLIGGLEYKIDKLNRGFNEVIISIPNNKNILGLTYWPFIQRKFYPSAKEDYLLRTRPNPVVFFPGKDLFLFTSDIYKNFSILNCADFLSLDLKLKLQGHIQSLYIPAMNYDSTTFEILAESAVRELYCYCCISNNRSYGSSLALAPFREKHDRTVFKVEGKRSVPEYHSFEIDVEELNTVQATPVSTYFQECKMKPLGNYKQFPSGWKKK